MIFLKQLHRRLWHHQNEQLMRLRLPRKSISATPQIVAFNHNDYLGLSTHPRVKEAAIEGVKRYGVGSTASALVAGYTPAHQLLEEKFAAFLGRKRALLFNSGYHANLGILSVFAQKSNQFFLDKYIHASLVDAVLLTRSAYQRYRHQDMDHLQQLLARNQLQANALNPIVVTEGVFSMQGDIAPLPQLVQLATQYQALLIVDDAHAMGVLGPSGKGSRDFYQIEESSVPLVNIPLGKALGSMGAIVAGDDIWIDALIQFSRTYMYTTAIAPALPFATAEALEVLQVENWRREMLSEKIDFFIKAATERQLPLLNTARTPIKNLLFKDNLKVMTVQKQLAEKGFLVAAIRSPTVAASQACLRISLNCDHTLHQIEHLLDLLVELHEF